MTTIIKNFITGMYYCYIYGVQFFPSLVKRGGFFYCRVESNEKLLKPLIVTVSLRDDNFFAVLMHELGHAADWRLNYKNYLADKLPCEVDFAGNIINNDVIKFTHGKDHKGMTLLRELRASQWGIKNGCLSLKERVYLKHCLGTYVNKCVDNTKLADVDYSLNKLLFTQKERGEILCYQNNVSKLS